MLLQTAIDAGTSIFQPCKVVALLQKADQVVRIQCLDSKDKPTELYAKLIVDASGRSAFMGCMLKCKERDPILSQSSAFAYFDHLHYSKSAQEGDIEVVQTGPAWHWIIPLREDRISVGATWTKEQIKSASMDIRNMYLHLIKNSSTMINRLADAKQITEIRVTADYSYRVNPRHGPGWVCVGDASTFVDPVAVFLSTMSAAKAFDLIGPLS